MSKSHFERTLHALVNKRKFAVNPEWEEIMDDYEQLRKSNFCRRKKCKDTGWYIYEVTNKGEKMYNKIKGKR